MCCYSSRLGIKELRKMMKENGGTMTFWKVVRAFTPHYLGGTEYRSLHNPNYFWLEGVHSCPEAIRVKKDECYPETGIDEGFHVYLDKNIAIRVRRRECSPTILLLEVTCNVKDLIGAEEYVLNDIHYTAVFSKVTVTKDQWKRLQRRTRDVRRKSLE